MSDPDIYRRLEALEHWRDEQAGAEVPLLGSGTSGRIPQWDATGQTLTDSTLAKTGAGLVTINAANAFTLELAAGTWTPSIIGETTPGTITYSANRVGNYTRIGPLCFIQFRAEVQSVSVAPAGNLLVSGLPFAGRNRSNGFWSIEANTLDSVNLAASVVQVSGRVRLNQNFMDFAEAYDNAGATLAQASVGAGFNIIASGWYEVEP